jgi:hypothetical protein
LHERIFGKNPDISGEPYREDRAMQNKLWLLLGLGGCGGAALFAVLGSSMSSAPAVAQAVKPVAAANPAHPVLVELFTSQGCSSCPPADAFVRELARAPGVIAISRPVTYWDQLGWKDTLARPGNDLLQRRYAARAIPGSGVYTPEIVVDGQAGAVGSDRAKVRALIARAAAKPAAQIGYSGGRVFVSNAAGSELRLLAIGAQRMVAIGRGENGGANLGYTNVVRDEKVTRCTASECSVAVASDFAKRAGGDRIVAIWQSSGGGNVRAVRWVETLTGK